MKEVIVTGAAEDVLRRMFPQADAHVTAWRRREWVRNNLTEQDLKEIEARRGVPRLLEW